MEPTKWRVKGKEEGAKRDAIVDPAADMTAFLLGGSQQQKPETLYTDKKFKLELNSEVEVSLEGKGASQMVSLSATGKRNLDELVKINLGSTFSGSFADNFGTKGIPAKFASGLKGAEIELVRSAAEFDQRKFDQQKLVYIGRKAIGKYGCYACHDIPGFETAKPIGTALADWGRKDPAKLDFGHGTSYLKLAHGHGHGHGKSHAGHGHDGDHHDKDPQGHHAGKKDADSKSSVDSKDPVDPWYLHQLESHNRIGFIYQKLREPRSFDFKKPINKFNDRLKMPKFPFDPAEREAVMTFVLGLVAEPPADQYVFKPDPRKEAILAGRKVLDKYNCGSCHILELERWDLAFKPAKIIEDEEEARFDLGKAEPSVVFPQLHQPMSSELIKKLKQPNPVTKLHHATIYGLPAIDNEAKPIVGQLDEEGEMIDIAKSDLERFDPSQLFYKMTLWKPAWISAHSENQVRYPVGKELMVPAEAIRKRYTGRGGYLTKYLLNRTFEIEKNRYNSQAIGKQVWGWLPPPLIEQGKRCKLTGCMISC